MTDSNFTVDPITGQTVTTAGDGSTFTVPVGDLPPASHAPHPELVEKLDHALEHLHILTQKVDHLLEHMHQPLHGTINIESPPKTPAGVTGDVTEQG
jgi:hypothetical protein|tara:strand:+ start:694 stop:984 length:291 start_codon:yes stop_codon:yes gene_type:complete